MKAKNVNIVRKAILKHGDGFWTTKDFAGNGNDCLFVDIVQCMYKEGLDFKIIKKKKSAAGRSIRRRIKK